MSFLGEILSAITQTTYVDLPSTSQVADRVEQIVGDGAHVNFGRIAPSEGKVEMNVVHNGNVQAVRDAIKQVAQEYEMHVEAENIGNQVHVTFSQDW